MASHREVKRAREAYYNSRLRDIIRENGPSCPNCGKKTGGCFVPPSFGEEGFFVCAPVSALAACRPAPSVE